MTQLSGITRARLYLLGQLLGGISGGLSAFLAVAGESAPRWLLACAAALAFGYTYLCRLAGDHVDPEPAQSVTSGDGDV